MIINTPEEREGIRAAGKLMGRILRETAAKAIPGVSAKELDLFAEREIRAAGAVPAFLGYPSSGRRGGPYPATLCVSINDEVVHSIPTKQKIIQEGDVVSLDCGLFLNSFCADMTITVIAGKGSREDELLVDGVREAMGAAARAAKAGGYIGDIGAAVSEVAMRRGLTVVRDLGGHGIGYVMHEDPFVPNFGVQGRGEKLRDGQVLAIEPILVRGKGAIELASDGWTYKTRDHSRAAEFEHTVIVGPQGGEIVTA